MNFEVRVVAGRDVPEVPRRAGADRPGRPGAPVEGADEAAGQAPYATTTHPFNTDRTDRKASTAAREAS